MDKIILNQNNARKTGNRVGTVRLYHAYFPFLNENKKEVDVDV